MHEFCLVLLLKSRHKGTNDPSIWIKKRERQHYWMGSVIFFFNALTVFDTVDWVTSGLSPHPLKVVFQNTWRKKTDGLPKSDLLGKWSRHILYDQRYSHDLVVISQSGHTSLKKVPIFPVPGSWKVLESRMGFESFGILYERSVKVL